MINKIDFFSFSQIIQAVDYENDLDLIVIGTRSQGQENEARVTLYDNWTGKRLNDILLPEGLEEVREKVRASFRGYKRHFTPKILQIHRILIYTKPTCLLSVNISHYLWIVCFIGQ